MTPLKFTLREAQLSLVVDLLEEAAAVAQKLCPDLFASEKASYTDDVTGSLDNRTFVPAGVRSSSPSGHLMG